MNFSYGAVAEALSLMLDSSHGEIFILGITSGDFGVISDPNLTGKEPKASRGESTVKVNRHSKEKRAMSSTLNNDITENQTQLPGTRFVPFPGQGEF
jgi:hypothetical protein